MEEKLIICSGTVVAKRDLPIKNNRLVSSSVSICGVIEEPKTTRYPKIEDL